MSSIMSRGGWIVVSAIAFYRAKSICIHSAVLVMMVWSAEAATFTNYQVIRTFGFTNEMARRPRSIIQGSDGALYGLSAAGGAYNLGAVFRLSKGGTDFGLVYTFRNDDNDGQYPVSLLEASDAVLYGTTGHGGASNGGTVFKVNRDGTGYSILHTFTPNGTDVEWTLDASLIVGSDGRLYGTTRDGGIDNVGAVFKLNRDGTGSTWILAHSRPGYVRANLRHRGGLEPLAYELDHDRDRHVIHPGWFMGIR